MFFSRLVENFESHLFAHTNWGHSNVSLLWKKFSIWYAWDYFLIKFFLWLLRARYFHKRFIHSEFIVVLYILIAWTNKEACFREPKWRKMMLRGHVIYQKMLCKKPVAEISLLQKITITCVSMTKNNSVWPKKSHWPISCWEKGLWPKTCSEKGLWPKIFWFRKGEWSKLCKAKRLMNKNFFIFHCQKIFDEKICLNLWKEKSLTETLKIKRWIMEKLFFRSFTVRKF